MANTTFITWTCRLQVQMMNAFWGLNNWVLWLKGVRLGLYCYAVISWMFKQISSHLLVINQCITKCGFLNALRYGKVWLFHRNNDGLHRYYQENRHLICRNNLSLSQTYSMKQCFSKMMVTQLFKMVYAHSHLICILVDRHFGHRHAPLDVWVTGNMQSGCFGCVL